MKVPNRILVAVDKLAAGTEVSPQERDEVRKWAKEGLTKRAAPAPVSPAPESEAT